MEKLIKVAKESLSDKWISFKVTNFDINELNAIAWASTVFGNRQQKGIIIKVDDLKKDSPVLLAKAVEETLKYKEGLKQDLVSNLEKALPKIKNQIKNEA